MYRPPDFTQPRFADSPDARFEPAPMDGVLPEGFFATTNLPTYVRVGGEWKLPRDPRMDSALVLDPDGVPRVLEGRYVRRGQRVAMGFAEDGSEGVFVHASGLLGDPDQGPEGEFKFMSSEVSREKPTDYPEMARLLVDERERGGRFIWVVGPAVLHSRGRDTLSWFVRNGYVGVLFGGNAVAVHDIEAATLGTTLGMDGRGIPVSGGHSFHMRAINRVRRAGSIAAAVEQGIITGGIMHALVTSGVPFVLCGSIRDDGPLPDTITDLVKGQEAMKEHRAALHRDRKHAPLVRVSRGDRRGAPAHHHLRGLLRVRGEQAQGPRHAPGLRRDHQRAGLPPRAAPLRGGRGGQPRARRRRLSRVPLRTRPRDPFPPDGAAPDAPLRRPIVSLSPALRLLLAGAVLAAAVLSPARVLAQGAASVDLRVTDGETGGPLAGAMVRLDGVPRAVSDTTGRVFLYGLEPGRHLIDVAMVGRRVVAPEVEVAGGEVLSLEVVLEPEAVALPGVEVFVPRGGEEPWREARRRAGRYVGRDEIARSRARLLSELLIRIGALQPDGRLRHARCVPRVVADGIALTGTSVDIFPLEDVEAVLVYNADVPPEYGGTAAGSCGVIAVWTRHG
jgi:hypothetical protein